MNGWFVGYYLVWVCIKLGLVGWLVGLLFFSINGWLVGGWMVGYC